MVTQARRDQERRHEDSHDLLEVAEARLDQGLSPPRELYLVQNRNRIRWMDFPIWARPSDPELFDGCCHEG